MESYGATLNQLTSKIRRTGAMPSVEYKASDNSNIMVIGICIILFIIILVKF